MILGSSIALGIYVPALSVKKQLEKLGNHADLICLEELYRDKESVMEETKRSFHNDFRLAKLSYRIPTRNKSALDPEATEKFRQELTFKKYDLIISFSGFWTEFLNQLQKECSHYADRIALIHMDAGLSLSWKGSDRSNMKEYWMYRLEDQTVFCTLEKTKPLSKKSQRILVHGGGWGIGEYQGKITRLNELGFPLDIIVYYPEEADPSDTQNDYYLLDPAWKNDSDKTEYPQLLKYQSGNWMEFTDNHQINPVRSLIENDIAILSKPGGGTLSDSLITSTPLILSEELASYEKENGMLWEQCGFGIRFEEFLTLPEKEQTLQKMQQRLYQTAADLPVITDLLVSSVCERSDYHE